MCKTKEAMDASGHLLTLSAPESPSGCRSVCRQFRDLDADILIIHNVHDVWTSQRSKRMKRVLPLYSLIIAPLLLR
jgi:hypothetical protein